MHLLLVTQAAYRRRRRGGGGEREIRERERGFFDNQEVTEGVTRKGVVLANLQSLPLSVWPWGTTLRTQGGLDIHLSVPII